MLKTIKYIKNYSKIAQILKFTGYKKNIMIIQAIHPYQNTQVPAFTGLTKKMKHRMYIDGKKDILEIMNSRDPSQTSYVGQLPPGIFYRLPGEHREEAIKEIMQAFDKAAVEIREFKPGLENSNTEFRNRRSDKTVEEMKKVFEKYNLIEPGEEFDIIFLGRGDYGSAFKLEGLYDNVTKDRYIIKVFTVADKGPEWHRFKSHGNYAEINTAEYWMHNMGYNTQRGKFYFGNIEAGYLVDNFIDNNLPQPKKIVNEYKYGAKLTDEELAMPNGHNKINNYSYDWGGVRVVNRVKNTNPTARYVLHQIKITPKKYRECEWWKIYYSKGLDETGKKAGLALSVKHFPNNKPLIKQCFNENIPLVDDALAYALKYLPYRYARKLFEELMLRNDPVTQTILMNEIPLLAKDQRKAEIFDDLDIPRDEIKPKKIEIFYNIAEKYALPDVREHLASYIHLLPEDKIMKKFDKLKELDDDRIYERLLHKMRVVKEDEYPLDLKFKMLDELENYVKDESVKKDIKNTRVLLIRRNLDETD